STRSERAEYVRLLRDSSEVKIDPQSCSSEAVPGGGHQATVHYRVTTDMAVFDLAVGLVGTDVRTRKAVSRQWFIDARRTSATIDSWTDNVQAILRAATG